MHGNRVTLSNDLAELPPSTWDELTHPSFYLSYDWLAARSVTIGGTPHFVMIQGGRGQPLLGFPVYTIGAASHRGYDPVALLLDAAHVEKWCFSAADLRVVQQFRGVLERAHESLRPAMVVAAPGRSGGLSYGPSLMPSEAPQTLETACDVMDSLAVRAGAPVRAWLYVPEGADPMLHRALTGRGYVPVLMDAECYLPIGWTKFEEYLEQFRAHHRRTIRQEMARFSRAGIRVELRGAEALTRELAVLEVQWRAKYGRDIAVTDIETHYALLRKHVDRSVRVFVARQNERAIGFTAFFEHQDVWYSRFGGFDYDAGKVGSYFNLLFYEPVREAICRGIKCIRYSTGGTGTKRSRGCLTANLLMYVRFSRDLVPAIGLQVLDRIQRQRFNSKPGAVCHFAVQDTRQR